MKKITLTSLIIFTLIVGYLYAYGPNGQGANIPQSDSSMGNTLEQIVTSNSVSNKKSSNHDINPPQIEISNIKYQLEQRSTTMFTLSDVSRHSTSRDCFIVINNNVYDVSAYIRYHPGGSSTIISRCGKELTDIFSQIHSNRAWDLLKKYKIGRVSTNKQNVTSQVLTAISDSLKKENPTAEVINVKPKNNFYIAKISYNNKLYEVHIDNKGQIVQEEIEVDEQNWGLWDTDVDDN